MATNELDNLAQQLRDLWVYEHRNFELRTIGKCSGWGQKYIAKWDGGEDYNGRTHESVWPRIAQLCMSNNLKPELLVRSMFYKAWKYPPKPNQAVGTYALEQYREFVRPATQLELKSNIINEFESEKCRVVAEVERKKIYLKKDETMAWRTTIVNKSEPLSSLFRYCVAHNQGWQDLCDEFYPAAIMKYREYPDIYDEVWKEWIPEKLKRDARGETMR